MKRILIPLLLLSTPAMANCVPMGQERYKEPAEYEMKSFSDHDKATSFARTNHGMIIKEQGQPIWRVIYGNHDVPEIGFICSGMEES